jgi:hypothetical protein
MVSCGFVPEQEEEEIDWFLASVHERTYESMHEHCINMQLQGTLTFSQLIKLYTHQFFSRYPHFQVEDLTKGDKYTNNSTRFQGKGKRRQHETYRKDERGIFRRNENGKGKGRANGYGNRRSNQDETNRKRFTQNSTHYKGKGKGRDKGKGKYGNEKGKGKGKGRGKGKSPQGYRKENNKEETTITSNSQRIYLDEPTAESSDDETTVMFTQNMNRLLERENGENDQNCSNEVQHEHNSNQSSLLSSTIMKLIKTMASLPDDHYVWDFPVPTGLNYYNEWDNYDELNQEEE